MLELLDVYVELGPELGLRLRKRRHLSMQSFGTVCLNFGLLALLFVACQVPLDFQLFGAKDRLEVELANLELVDETFKLRLESIALNINNHPCPAVHIGDWMEANIQFVELQVGPAASAIFLFLHSALDFPNRTFKLFRELLPLLLLILCEFLALVLPTRKPSCMISVSGEPHPLYTLMRLFSFCSSLHNVSSLCFILTAFCISDLDWSFSFCSWSARFLDLA